MKVAMRAALKVFDWAVRKVDEMVDLMAVA